MLKKICDKCGAEIVEYPGMNMILPYYKISRVNPMNLEFPQHYVDLCADCQKKLTNWLDGKGDEILHADASASERDGGRSACPPAQKDSKTRLLTLEEALSVKGAGWEEVWFEADPDVGEAEYKECFECVFIYGHIRCADGNIGDVMIERYNRPYYSRLWMGEDKPTDEQRKAAEWDG